MRKKSSNKALKSLLIMFFFLISASFLAPDVLDIWASTQKNDFRRDLARDWSGPMQSSVETQSLTWAKLRGGLGQTGAKPRWANLWEGLGQA